MGTADDAGHTVHLSPSQYELLSDANSGKVISLDEYIKICHQLMATDKSLVEIFALDVIGDPKASAKNCAAMWKAGIPAIPCFDYGEPESALMEMAAAYPKIAI